jgi:hypothetical protein
MSRLTEIDATLTRLLAHQQSRRPRLTKIHMAVCIEALSAYGDILDAALEMPAACGIKYLMETIPNLTRQEAKAMLENG